MGRQYCAVDSMTTSSTCSATSQSASPHSSLGLVPTLLRSNWYSPPQLRPRSRRLAFFCARQCRQFGMSLAPPDGSGAHAKNKLFRVSGYCGATTTAAPTYSLNDACAGPANLSASTSPLDVRSLSPPVTVQCGKGGNDFHDVSRAHRRRQLNWYHHASSLACSRAPLASLGSWHS